ncbi:hypothetical protein H2200_006312 [Cladophialophora chaetospira]|uniref:Uncharacterized protein n=1 Tax=Cladophialophora chaetospira TaxID=386627 RepID=A0AA38XAN8_9EURO|nr:hypothetical protein H2200_006312 [Cladophialophora chaetospira]
MPTSQLTKNDSSVLSALFDPESSLSSTVQVNDRSSTSSISAKQRSLQERERIGLRSINQEQPSSEEIQQSISLLNTIIQDEPHYASAWNNRAQAYRLLITDEDFSKNPLLVAEIFADLAQAISLATPEKASTAVSSADAKVLASAHTHRGYLLLLASKSKGGRAMLSKIPGLRGMSVDDFEEAASRDLAMGGRYGNETARQLAVKTNPYAKLCGSIVREALTKEIADYYQPQLHLAG